MCRVVSLKSTRLHCHELVGDVHNLSKRSSDGVNGLVCRVVSLKSTRLHSRELVGDVHNLSKRCSNGRKV